MALHELFFEVIQDDLYYLYRFVPEPIVIYCLCVAVVDEIWEILYKYIQERVGKDLEKKLFDSNNKLELSKQTVQEKTQELLTMSRNLSKQVKLWRKYNST